MEGQWREEEFLSCSGSRRFAREMVNASPFADLDHAVRSARDIWFNRVDVKGWLEGFSAHPEIGSTSKSISQWSKEEQSAALATATDYAMQELVEWNARYKEKFGYVFLICASGRGTPEILAELKKKNNALGNNMTKEKRCILDLQNWDWDNVIEISDDEVINFSTGRVINKLQFENEISAMDNDHTGQLIFAGDAQGCIYSVSVNSNTGSISRSHRNRSSRSKSRITTVQYRSFSLVARCPVLLVCAQDGYICFFSVAFETQGYLTLLCSLKLAPRIHNIRASFCPLLSLEKGEFIVSGSEDANVYFYDLTKPKHACVNKLQGHGSPVIGIAWNHGENLLASSDADGTVIVWKRAKTR